jgi:hypothetical protein
MYGIILKPILMSRNNNIAEHKRLDLFVLIAYIKIEINLVF